MNKYQNKYRAQSHRMPHWDYSENGYYFITMVTQNRACNLGHIIDNKMVLSDFGNIVKTQWVKSFEIRDELTPDTFIIMPNHIHAIVVLKKNNKIQNDPNETDGVVETHGRAFQRRAFQRPFIRKPRSISSFIAGFKSAVNSKIDDYIDEHKLDIPKYNRHNHFFQPNYYDHVIRNDQEYKRVSEYIINNPKNWLKDKIYEHNKRKHL
ncbi:MAG: hypothetical protein JXR70_10300 [Spirochaetales bacterium]|nr:hypothetical protein [Spirochaetales bacterium]